MTEDKELEELFSTANTVFDDNEQFLSVLSNNLDKIEYVKQLQKSKRYRYRLGMIATFAAGVVSALIALFVFPLLPYDAQIFGFLINASESVAIVGQGKILSYCLFAILSGSIVFALLSVIRDIMRTRKGLTY